MNDYLRRSVKFIFYLIVIFLLVLVVFPLILGKMPQITWNEIINDQKMIIFLGFLLAYSLVYPLIAFAKIKRHLNGPFSDNRQYFEKAFETLQYIKTEETGDKIVYRKKSKYVRFVQWYEDSIVILINENPVIMSGMRKSVARVDRIIDQLITRNSE